MLGMIVGYFVTVAGLSWVVAAFATPLNAGVARDHGIAREEELWRNLDLLDRKLADDFWRRYVELVALRKSEAIRPDSPEAAELRHMTNEMECVHADRLALLQEIAGLRGTSLAELLKDDAVTVRNHG